MLVHVYIPIFNATHLALPITPTLRDYGWKLAAIPAEVGVLSSVVSRTNLSWIVRGPVIFGVRVEGLLTLDALEG